MADGQSRTNGWRPECCLCAGLRDGDSREQIVAESADFVAVPTVGAFLEGWLLVVPKRHVLSLGALPRELEHDLATFRSVVQERLTIAYGPVVSFEHGPAIPGSSVGCTVDHAHLHMVPVPGDIDLLGGADAVVGAPIKWTALGHPSEVRRFTEAGVPYLYVGTPDGEHWAADASTVPSQLMRRVVANHIGRPDKWDWRRFPEEHAYYATVGRLASAATA